MDLDKVFCESLKSTDHDKYHEDLALGRLLAASSSIQFLALTRDAAPCWPRFIERITRLGDSFENWSLACYENDSKDRTVALIRDSAVLESRVSLLSEALGKKKWRNCRCQERGQDMGSYRERLRAFALDKPATYNLVAVFDVDIETWSPDSFLSALPAISQHEAIWALGLQVRRGKLEYYDAWATRLVSWQPLSYRSVVKSMANLWPGMPGKTVLSGYGGLAIYRRAFYERGSYLGNDCEHVNFHRTACSEGKFAGVRHSPNT